MQVQDEPVLVLKNEGMEGILDMGEAIEAMEIAFRELAQGVAVNRPRSRIRVYNSNTNLTYYFNNLAGAVPHFQAMGLRIDSSFSRDVEIGGIKRREYPGDYVGLVFLFNMEDCRLLAIMDDHYLSAVRVAATSGVGTRYLARKDAKTLGLFGSGEQARTQLMAMAAIRKLEKVKVFSPNPEHRQNFARQMGQLLELDVEAVDNPREVVSGADIVNAATNTMEPVFNGEWLEEGTHVNSIVGGDVYQKRQELDDEAIRRSELIIVTSKEQIFLDKQADIYDRIERGMIKEEELYELGELLTGKIPGRTSSSQITLFKNNTGMGIQFAAIAFKMYQLAKVKGTGKKLDPELFITHRGDKVYAP